MCHRPPLFPVSVLQIFIIPTHLRCPWIPDETHLSDQALVRVNIMILVIYRYLSPSSYEFHLGVLAPQNRAGAASPRTDSFYLVCPFVKRAPSEHSSLSMVRKSDGLALLSQHESHSCHQPCLDRIISYYGVWNSSIFFPPTRPYLSRRPIFSPPRINRRNVHNRLVCIKRQVYFWLVTCHPPTCSSGHPIRRSATLAR